MRLRRVTLQHFRNIAFADLTFSARQQFFVGANAQGKTALLEAIGVITALRSFRASDNRLLITHGQTEAAIACEIEHERFGASRVVIRLRTAGKEVTCDGERIQRLGDYLGRFPTVVFSSQDQLLVRGAPTGRRRWMDSTLSAMDGAYLRSLQQYHRALADRNALLKRGAQAKEIEAFERPLAAAAAMVVQQREQGAAVIGSFVSAAYSRIADGAEPCLFAYEPDALLRTEEAWSERFERARQRDLVFRSTTVGPHRDDYGLLLSERPARDFGSEGQQRSLVLALRLAQLAYFREKCGVEPLLLADDVLGELDPRRRERFWASLGSERQVLATGTRLPEADLGAWEVFDVASGAFAPRPEGPAR
ncbi:DNA replication and repair protein RecF [Opitutaceae bacterium EW11]|nr:DNA replication and repair protein RecF [Opitutaceae bacterium EW11]